MIIIMCTCACWYVCIYNNNNNNNNNNNTNNIWIITRIRLQGHEHILAGVIFIMRELKYSNIYTYA